MATAPRILLFTLAVLAVFAWRHWTQRAIEHAPGVLVAESPVQHDLPPGSSFERDGHRLSRRAEFTIRARVLSAERYRFGPEAALSPVDLALGWGPMSDQQVLDRIEISQRNRWYFTRWELPGPLAERQIISNSGNMHIIPVDDGIAREVRSLRRGEIVNLRGYLVDVENDAGFRWRTSLTRDDTGQGSCEIFLLEFIQREPPPG